MIKLFSSIRNWMAKPLNRTLVHFILLIAIVIANTYFQAFCVPTPWAMVIVVVLFMYSGLRPIIHPRNTNNVLFSIADALAFMLFVYCIAFIEESYFFALVGILLFGLGLLAFIPVYFAGYFLKHTFNQSNTSTNKWVFAITLSICLALVGYTSIAFKQAAKEVDDLVKLGPSEFEDSFMAEKIIGMHMIYHTKILLIIDGWRPPKHEPILILGYLLNKREDPLDMTLEERIELYQKTYPDKPIKFDCACAMEYSNSYHNDRRLQ